MERVSRGSAMVIVANDVACTYTPAAAILAILAILAIVA